LLVIIVRKIDVGKNDLILKVIQTLNLDRYLVIFQVFAIPEFKNGLLD
jgi:hypothetical protein